MTKKEMFAEIRKVIVDNADMVDLIDRADDMVAFIDHEIELLNRKSGGGTRKPTKTQLENEGFKTEILNFLETAEEPVTIKELQAEIESLAGLSNQRITHMLTALRKDGKVARTYIKKVPYYGLGNEAEAEAEMEEE